MSPTTHIQAWSGRRVEPVKAVEESHLDNLKLSVSTTFPAGTILGCITATGLYRAYATGNVDGSQVPTHVLEYDVVTNAGGDHFIGDAASSEHGHSYKYASAWRGGVFDTADLVGLDAGGVTAGKFRVIQGDLTTGRVVIPGS